MGVKFDPMKRAFIEEQVRLLQPIVQKNIVSPIPLPYVLCVSFRGQ